MIDYDFVSIYFLQCIDKKSFSIFVINLKHLFNYNIYTIFLILIDSKNQIYIIIRDYITIYDLNYNDLSILLKMFILQIEQIEISSIKKI